MSRLTIMQGLPGSGKSTAALVLAQQSLEKGLSCVILSTDQFFMKDGVYCFDGSKIPQAHQDNQARAAQACQRHIDHIIIDNTNMQRWEAKPYVKIALGCNYAIDFAYPLTPWAQDATECYRLCKHGVPLDSIRGMLSRMQVLTVESCMEAKAPWEKAA